MDRDTGVVRVRSRSVGFRRFGMRFGFGFGVRLRRPLRSSLRVRDFVFELRVGVSVC